MRALLFALLGASIALSGCDRREAAAVKQQEPKQAAAQPAACAPPPVLLLSPDFADPGRKFGSKELEATKANFAAAYQKSCQIGLLRDEALMDAEAGQPTQLLLHNAPEANIISIYSRGRGSEPGPMVLEYHFVSHEGVHVPSVEDLEEAIYCTVKGATPQEEEESGRCLPD